MRLPAFKRKTLVLIGRPCPSRPPQRGGCTCWGPWGAGAERGLGQRCPSKLVSSGERFLCLQQSPARLTSACGLPPALQRWGGVDSGELLALKYRSGLCSCTKVSAPMPGVQLVELTDLAAHSPACRHPSCPQLGLEARAPNAGRASSRLENTTDLLRKRVLGALAPSLRRGAAEGPWLLPSPAPASILPSPQEPAEWVVATSRTLCSATTPRSSCTQLHVSNPPG